MLPLTLVGERTIAVAGLLDTGAAVNVLPYATGIELGLGAALLLLCHTPLLARPLWWPSSPNPFSRR
jgi:hypothetical protein